MFIFCCVLHAGHSPALELTLALNDYNPDDIGHPLRACRAIGAELSGDVVQADLRSFGLPPLSSLFACVSLLSCVCVCACVCVCGVSLCVLSLTIAPQGGLALHYVVRISRGLFSASFTRQLSGVGWGLGMLRRCLDQGAAFTYSCRVASHWLYQIL